MIAWAKQRRVAATALPGQRRVAATALPGQRRVAATALSKQRRVAAVAASVLAVAAVAACGSSSGGGAGGGGASSSPGVRQAEAIARASLKNPTSIGISAPLSKAPAKGKFIISLSTQTPSNYAVEDGMREAAAVLGWRFKTVPVPSTPTGIQEAFSLAIAQHPNGIRVSGVPRQEYEAQLTQAASMGIAVVQDSANDPPGHGLINTAISNLPQVRAYGRLAADWIIADSKGAAHVALFNIPQFPVLTANADAFKAEMASKCPKCKVTLVSQRLTDIGVNTPSAAVDAVRRDPSINYLDFTLGDLSDFVARALRAAGIGTDKVKLCGSVPTQADIAALKAGQSGAWTAFASPVMGWRVMDIFARYFGGDSLTPVNASPFLPTQLLTKQNINSIVTDPSAMDWYVGVANYSGQFKRLWHLS